MDQKHLNKIRKINYLISEMNALYHLASLKMRISDSVSIVLYTIYDSGNGCLLSDVYKKSGISKQTVNSAVRKLETEEILYLEQHTGRSKRIFLTDRGKTFVRETVARLYEAEAGAFDTWREEEVNTYINLMKKYADCLRQQIDRL
nr:MarR family transcriptional regulator [uncultured Blautia sp.]